MFAESVVEDLHNCLKCAACQAVCPTYRATRMERYAPRGRVQMVKKFIEGDLAISKGLYEALMSCILCEACAHACPSGVRLDRVFENVRMELHEAFGATLPKRALFAALRSPLLMRLGASVARLGQKAVVVPFNLSWKVGSIPVKRLPSFNDQSFRSRMGEVAPAKGKRAGRVLYFTGCATDLINEDVGLSVVEVLTHLGIEVIIPQEQVCCSVPIFLSGARREALPNIRKNLALFDRDDVDAIVVDCATCGGGLKKGIPHLMEDLGLDPGPARRVAAKVRDVSQIVSEHIGDLPLRRRFRGEALAVTYHDPCHLVRSMGVSKEPRKLLAALEDVSVLEMPGADQCCGGAGSFQFEHVEMSRAVTGRKKENIRSTGAQIVATGCPGCRLTLSGNLYETADPLVCHTIQLVAERLEKTV
jgi:glycolate oxidase iron-sulfur subunit